MGDVPSLKAPGFIKCSSKGRYNDASSASVEKGNLVLMARSTTPEYKGFKLSIASGASSTEYACASGGTLPFSRGCFKAEFSVPDNSNDFQEIRIPLKEFSDLWSPATGEHTKNCTDADTDACLTSEKLKKIQLVEIWAEGVDGDVHLEISEIFIEPNNAAVEINTNIVAADAAVITEDTDSSKYFTCAKPVQSKLRFNISSRTTPENLMNVVNDENEALATAVCCDSRTKYMAEPRFLFTAPDIMLFNKISENNVTTFYDSVCGLPLFQAPVGRSLEDFEADTNEHGWPSFRKGEIFEDNVIIEPKKNGLQTVRSKCGTHLGTYLPDEKGIRYCIDLSCISGNQL